ncbi:MAG TPA: hypothetical protein VMA73_20475 [Streptosporangiaceae bacterium]|nr:hypothetical protein [Streptosporangiaceae bacterium]
MGVLTTILLTDYLNKHNPILVALIGVIFLLALLLGISTRVLRVNELSMDSIEAKIAKLLTRTGLSVEYVEDGDTGESYARVTALIKAAKDSLTFVDMWQPYEDYQLGSPERVEARKEFYQAIINQVEHHQHGHEMFHRRIVQVPEQYAGQIVPFNLDPYFSAYLDRVAQIQVNHYETCSLRVTPVHVMEAHFIIIDRRYIVLPILTTDANTNHQIRHGALLFDDRDGDLFRSLRGIYRAIDSRAYPLAPSEPIPAQKTKKAAGNTESSPTELTR